MVRCYLDIDGVICPLGPGVAGFGDWRHHRLTPWSPQMAAELEALDAERHWLTTWQGEANQSLAPLLGWDPLPVVARCTEVLWWKLDAIVATHPPGVPFIWCDDELEARTDDLEGRLQRRLARLGSPYLLLCPKPTTGLTPADLSTLRAFAAEHAP